MAMAESMGPSESKLLKVLPEVFQVAADTSSPLQALLAVAEDMHEPVRQLLDRIHTVPDPGRAPSSLIPFLSRWVDLDWLTLPGPEAGAGSGSIPATSASAAARWRRTTAARGVMGTGSGSVAEKLTTGGT